MLSAATTRLRVELVAPVARITLDYAPLNIIDIPMMEELSSALAQIDARADLSAIILEGAGGAFSAGGNIHNHTTDKISAMLEKFHAIIRVLIATKKVTIASVDGVCLGGGAELAMVCDMVFTARDARWGFPEI